MRETVERPSPPRETAPARQRTLLLVDDDRGVRELVSRVLLEENYEVITAENGKEALQKVADNPTDLVLLDINLPIKNGWEVFERLSYDHPLIPIIIITARPNQLFSALGAGVGALMEKPLDFPKLLQMISDLLDEPLETRLARLAGRATAFHYQPSSAGLRR